MAQADCSGLNFKLALVKMKLSPLLQGPCGWGSALKAMGRGAGIYYPSAAPQLCFGFAARSFSRKLSVALAAGLTLINLHCPAADFGVGSQLFGPS
jgi:hypothetical protein